MNANAQTALMWIGKGVSPIPVKPKSKIPAMDWRLWQNHVPPPKVVDYWFKDPQTNVGIICGGKSNLSIIDFDDIEYYYDWRKDMNKRSDVWGDVARKSYKVRTPRGMHVYVKTKTPEHSRKISEGSVDIRCSGNYTLCPPSVHPSGSLYEPIGSPELIIPVNSISEVFPETLYKPSTEIVVPCREPDIFDQGVAASNVVQDIKNTVSILSFVAQFSQVYRSSPDGRWWYARCIHPHHADHHPSFRVDTRLGRAKCMSSKCQLHHDVGLDVIDLYAIMNHVSNKDAIRDLEMYYLK